MSHLVKIVDLQEAMSAANIRCPVQQAEVIESAFVRAAISYGFRKCAVTKTGFGEAAGEKILAQLDKWNRVSPIAGGRIYNTAAMLIREAYIGGEKGGLWGTYKTPVLHTFENLPPALVEAYESLFTKLREELTLGEE